MLTVVDPVIVNVESMMISERSVTSELPIVEVESSQAERAMAAAIEDMMIFRVIFIGLSTWWKEAESNNSCQRSDGLSYSVIVL